MTTAWQILERAGVPFGTRTEPPDLGDRRAIAAAVHRSLTQPELLSERQRESLFAWLRAWAADWPSSFASSFGSSAVEILARAAEGVEDPSRYVKLRRLAREQLARVL